MFSPENYYSWTDMTEMTHYWAGLVLTANRLESKGDDPSKAFSSQIDPDRTTLGHTAEEHKAWVTNFSERPFQSGLVSCCLLARVLQEYPPTLCSPTGILLKAPFAALFHEDRLDWCYWDWPLRSAPALRAFFELFDKGNFRASDLFNRFCCIDGDTGLLANKNNTLKSFDSASHIWFEPGEAEKIIDRTIKPFEGWAITWNPDDFPSSLFDILDAIGIDTETWRGKSEVLIPPKKGRPRYQKAFEAFAEMNFDRGDLQWKELINSIGQSVGEYPSEATYRSWTTEAPKEKEEVEPVEGLPQKIAQKL